MVEFTAKEYATLFATNFESVFHMCQLAHPLLKASRAGNVVFTSPVFGFVSLKFMSVHEATKGAINQLTRNLACEWAKDNIWSNAVSPWYIKTSLVEQTKRMDDWIVDGLNKPSVGLWAVCRLILSRYKVLRKAKICLRQYKVS
ncbi:hypothetical protein HYC85_007775 [Camellia sinensis]|uniref:Tropinone reductase n=1 Tax=Camellia sinensis TaxID=4442 RepID=A0A7J7HQK3_CAMSI|nr:hypothetical protein HYC85_007775 [Camellia sinensis]